MYFKEIKNAHKNVINHSLTIKKNALYLKLNRLGIKTLTMSKENTVAHNIGHHSYLNIIYEYSRAGLLKEVKKEAKKHIAEYLAIDFSENDNDNT